MTQTIVVFARERVLKIISCKNLACNCTHACIVRACKKYILEKYMKFSRKSSIKFDSCQMKLILLAGSQLSYLFNVFSLLQQIQRMSQKLLSRGKQELTLKYR
ncbi:Hypothetical_protein [Hexamita inflata]|uniref:Hypothetical_protein n=1 Tax=Hexamita inflata TaxID=28002 RepID=A0ABP1JEY3_9EUKA